MRAKGFALAVAGMVAVVAASNVLVQYPVEARLGALDLADILTWGAFTYPFAFLVTDLTNRSLGPRAARHVVYVGFALGVVLSVWLSTPRIALASGTAFLAAQLLDIAVFHRLRHQAWWRPPAVSTLVGSLLDTALFFSLAFSARFAFLDTALGGADGSLAFEVPFLGAGPAVPLWVSLAAGDLAVKLLLAAATLLPYRLAVNALRPWRPAAL
jgi:queuosine precursor transporter